MSCRAAQVRPLTWEVGIDLTDKHAKVLAVGAVAGVAAALTVGLSAPSGATATASHGRGGDQQVRLDRAFIIVLENHSEKSVIGDPNTPYITSLAQQYGQAANYYGVTHPSEPNYIAMIGGSNWFTNTDNPANRFDHTNLVDELDASHISWGAYMEAMPASDPLTDFWPSSADPLYASKHNPFALFTDIRDNPARVANIKPYTALAGDLNSPRAPAVRVHHAGPVQRHARRGERRDRRAPGDPVPVQQHQRRPERRAR